MIELGYITPQLLETELLHEINQFGIFTDTVILAHQEINQFTEEPNQSIKNLLTYQMEQKFCNISSFFQKVELKNSITYNLLEFKQSQMQLLGQLMKHLCIKMERFLILLSEVLVQVFKMKQLILQEQPKNFLILDDLRYEIEKEDSINVVLQMDFWMATFDKLKKISNKVKRFVLKRVRQTQGQGLTIQMCDLNIWIEKKLLSQVNN